MGENFFQTTPLDNNQIKTMRQRVDKQDDIVLLVFQKRPGIELTPWDVLRLSDLNCPITSIRRSMTTLTAKGLLEKTGDTQEGAYGMPCHLWRLATNKGEQMGLWD